MAIALSLWPPSADDGYRGTSLIRNTPSKEFTVALCLGTQGDPRRVGVSYERGTPVLPIVTVNSAEGVSECQLSP